ncbi:MAG: NirD/YgiW/YdeI family stress tolerance protein [Spirochaetaceae bacterium]|jgi:uncharacterized protein (TIGR00156 family)|nr:NirD/YgiW/YdeI family stress tolerance protein [Spirochaetaceae bacterium]
MKKTVLLAALFCCMAVSAFAQSGYTGPGSDAGKTAITVAEAKKLWDDTPVTLHGFITRALRDEKYEFTDDAGDTMIIDIDDDFWRLNPEIKFDDKQRLEIKGKIDVDDLRKQVEVRNITLL